MRPDQYIKLNALSEQLADVFMEEANPDKWPGAGQELEEMDKQTRGDRYWSKKNAVATLTLIGKVEAITATAKLPTAADAEDTRLLDEEINAAEKEAKALLNSMHRKNQKAEFDRRVHGKA